MIAPLFPRLSLVTKPLAILWCVPLAVACKGEGPDADRDADGDGFVASQDCDDGDATVHPSATEVCNEIDDNCDGEVDEGVLLDYHLDADGDGYGTDVDVSACAATPNASPTDDDCDDSDPNVHPDATEICANGKDDDCNGQDLATETWYADADGDGYGDPATSVEDCEAPPGFIDDATDCDDGDAAIHPDASDPCDAIDSDCDGDDHCFIGEVSLSDADAKYTGDVSDSQAGLVAGAGDVNGDGYDDVLVGTFFGDAYLVLGGPSPASASLSAADARYTADINFRPVAGAGDVDGDGYDDILMGDFWPGSNAAYLVLGGPSPVSESFSEADAVYSGEAADDYAGYTVAGAGDVNGDDHPDILVGASINNDGGEYAGAAYLVLGGSSPASASLADADAEYTGEADWDRAAQVAGAGDVDGDGHGDILVGSYAGGAYLVLGGPSPVSASLADADAKYTNGGLNVAGAGDVNGDGYDDVLASLGASGAAGVSLVLGGPSPASTPLPAADAVYTGEAVDDLLNGATVAGAGDVDGDGYDDFLVGAQQNDDGATDAGAAYLLLGGPSPASTSLSAANAEYTGEAWVDWAGCSVAGAGDVDGDGDPDILVGANLNGGTWAGAAYLVLSGGL